MDNNRRIKSVLTVEEDDDDDNELTVWACLESYWYQINEMKKNEPKLFSSKQMWFMLIPHYALRMHIHFGIDSFAVRDLKLQLIKVFTQWVKMNGIEERIHTHQQQQQMKKQP